MTQYKELRGDLVVTIPVPSAAAGAAGGGSVIVPHKARIVGAKWIPGAAITANGTNYFTLTFRNRAASGSGTAQWATARAYSATNGVVSTPETLTLSGTSANLDVAAGDVLSAEITHTGTGLACPGGSVVVTLRSAG